MKTKFKYVALAALTLLASLNSCSNDEDGGKPNNGTPKSMFLKISSDIPSTYAEGPIQDATAVKFTSGILYFVDNAGTIKGRKTIGAPATSPDIDITNLATTGEVITGVDGSVTKVYIVGNTPVQSLPNGATTISQVENTLLQVQSQGTISNVNLFGSDVLVAPTGAATDPYTCNVTLKPTVARIELTNMTATGNYITGFKVAGIFVDNYYSQAGVNGAVLTTNLKDNGPSTTAFNDGSAQYPNTPAASSLKTFVFDWFTPALAATGNPLKAQPTTANNVWGYNLFATSTGSTVPRIVIRLTNITTTADGANPVYGADQYITIKGYKNGGNLLTVIKAGEVYNITGLSFDETKLTPTPNLATIDVEVKVTLVNWKLVPVTPEL